MALLAYLVSLTVIAALGIVIVVTGPHAEYCRNGLKYWSHAGWLAVAVLPLYISFQVYKRLVHRD